MSEITLPKITRREVGMASDSAHGWQTLAQEYPKSEWTLRTRIPDKR